MVKIREESVQRALENYYRERSYTVLREVETPVGYIDLLVYKGNEKRLIEVKEKRSLKHAIGQILTYKEHHKDATLLEIVYFSYDGKHRNLDSTYGNSDVVKKFNIKLTSIQEYLDIGEVLRWQEEVLREVELQSSMNLMMDLSQENTSIQVEQNVYLPELERLIGKW